jgi:hypothetical protein
MFPNIALIIAICAGTASASVAVQLDNTLYVHPENVTGILQSLKGRLELAEEKLAQIPHLQTRLDVAEHKLSQTRVELANTKAKLADLSRIGKWLECKCPRLFR